jgi:hypothetical protein
MDSFTDKLESVSLNEKSSATSATQSLDDAQKLEGAPSLAIASPDTTEGTSMREEAVALSSTLDASGKTAPGEDGESSTPLKGFWSLPIEHCNIIYRALLASSPPTVGVYDHELVQFKYVVTVGVPPAGRETVDAMVYDSEFWELPEWRFLNKTCWEEACKERLLRGVVTIVF